MLRYQDFVPQMMTAPAFLRQAEYESFDAAVVAADKWIADNRIEVEQIETVVLPNIWARWEEGSGDPSLGVSGDSPSHWHQFIRIWFRA